MARWRIVSLALGFLFVTSEVRSQTLPMPALPPEAVPQAHLKGWDYAVGAGFGYDTNIEFRPDGPSGIGFTPRGQLGRTFYSPRGNLSALATGRWTGYPSDSDLNRYYADIGLGGEYQLSDRTSIRGGASYQLAYTDGAVIVLQQGVALPLVPSRSVVGRLAFAWRTGTRTTLRIDGRYYRTTFDSPTLIDGASLRGGVTFERQLSPRTTGAILYAVEDFVSTIETRPDYLTHFLSLQWTRFINPQSAFLLEAGVSHTPDAAQVGLDRKQGFFGGASYSHRILTRSSGLVFLRRELTPAFGLGATLFETRAGGRADVPLGKDWHLRTGFGYTYPDKPKDPNTPRVYSPYTDVFVSVSRHLGRYLEASGESRYRRRGATTAVSLSTSFQVGFYVTLTPPGRARPDWSPF